ncbi:hypothetical protein IAR55_004382 [Kwoniella newhampshirensis]|uniref:Ima1 N-terminal domain-containing protein n=1 Tax=Kwoniella newhampshirensis TaxID=1651941 RepID=A0AAW0YWW4_9TREE
MPFLRSASRPQPVQCFFCLSPSLLPPHSSSSSSDRKGKGRIAEVGTQWNWQCERCGCWNIKDEKGEMISDLPAMHSSSYNTASFSLRAKPSTSHLPPASSSTSPFCHSCLANQTLIMNMLANYLPDDNDPLYPALFADLPTYLSKLHTRYPPVCQNCQPAVDEALRRSDHRAQVEAWGSALRRGAATTNTSGGDGGDDIGRGVSSGDILVWRIRGALYWTGTGLSLSRSLLAAMAPSRLGHMSRQRFPGSTITLSTGMVLFHALSILWIAWDPYWLRRVRRRDRTKVQGRAIWVRNMLYIMVLRLASSLALWHARGAMNASKPTNAPAVCAAFALEIALLLQAFAKIRVTQPIAIKLVRPVPLHPSPAPPPASYSTSSHVNASTGISSLSVGSQTPTRQVNPIFGQPSLHHQNQSEVQVSAEAESMDWEPSPSAVLANGGYTHRPAHWSPEDDQDDICPPSKLDWDTFAMNKQRMFPKQGGQDETGLESLLEGWGIGASGITTGATEAVHHSSTQRNKNAAGDVSNTDSFVQWLGFVLVALRLTGMATTVAFTSPSTGSFLGLFNTLLLCFENIIACSRIFAALKGDQRSSAESMKIALAVVEIGLRAIALSPQSLIKVMLDKVGNSRAASLEWSFWAVVDLIGLSA